MGFRIANPLDQDPDLSDGCIVEFSVGEGNVPFACGTLYCYGQPVWECTGRDWICHQGGEIWLQLDLTRGQVQIRLDNHHLGIVHTLPGPVLTPVVAACRNIRNPIRLL